MRAITVHLPWTYAIAEGWKPTENRSRTTKYRGELAIHAGAQWSDQGANDPACRSRWHGPSWPAKPPLSPVDFSHLFRRIIAIVDVVGCHQAEPLTRLDGTVGSCCEPWGWLTYHGGKARVFHWEFANARRPARTPEMRGRLGLWTVPDDLAEALR